MISTRDRQKAVELITESVQAGARAVEACKCLGIAFSSYLKWRQNPQSEDRRPKREFGPNSRALSEEERQAVYERYCQPDVCDLSVRQAFHALLDKGEYLASEATVYRVLRRHKANTRRDGVRSGVKRYKPTSYEATGPNQVWSWDITQSIPHAFITCSRWLTSTAATWCTTTCSMPKRLRTLSVF